MNGHGMDMRCPNGHVIDAVPCDRCVREGKYPCLDCIEHAAAAVCDTCMMLEEEFRHIKDAERCQMTLFEMSEPEPSGDLSSASPSARDSLSLQPCSIRLLPAPLPPIPSVRNPVRKPRPQPAETLLQRLILP